MQKFKKGLALALALVLCLSLMSVGVFADEEETEPASVTEAVQAAEENATEENPVNVNEVAAEYLEDKYGEDGRFYVELSSDTGAAAQYDDDGNFTGITSGNENGTDTTVSFYVDKDYNVEFVTDGSKILSSDFEVYIGENAATVPGGNENGWNAYDALGMLGNIENILRSGAGDKLLLDTENGQITLDASKYFPELYAYAKTGEKDGEIKDSILALFYEEVLDEEGNVASRTLVQQAQWILTSKDDNADDKHVGIDFTTTNTEATQAAWHYLVGKISEGAFNDAGNDGNLLGSVMTQMTTILAQAASEEEETELTAVKLDLGSATITIGNSNSWTKEDGDYNFGEGFEQSGVDFLKALLDPNTAENQSVVNDVTGGDTVDIGKGLVNGINNLFAIANSEDGAHPVFVFTFTVEEAGTPVTAIYDPVAQKVVVTEPENLPEVLVEIYGNDDYDYYEDDTPAAPAAVTIEDEATPLSALPEEFDTLTVTIGDEEVPLAEIPLAYNDVAVESWARDAIAYVTATGIMIGTAEDGSAFSPAATTTGEMLTTMVERLLGEDAVGAALTEGIAYDPYEAVSREQLITILYRAAAAEGYDVSASADLSAFADAGELSGFASEAMAWAVSVGLIKGMGDGTLNATGSVTREQIATIFMRYSILLGK